MGDTDEHEDRQHDQRRQHADGEEVRGPDQQRDGEADADEGQVEDEPDPAGETDLEDGHGEGEREAEGHHLATRFVTLFPERASLAHTVTVRRAPRPAVGAAPLHAG